MNFGIVRMDQDWQYEYANVHARQIQMYHLFGDPTTPLWVALPKNITVSHAGSMSLGANSYALSSMNISKGVATLLNNQTVEIMGKTLISGAGVTIPITNQPTSNGTATLAITSQGYKPYIKKITIGFTIIHDTNLSNSKPSIAIKGSKVYFGSSSKSHKRIVIYNIQGKEALKLEKINSKNNCFIVDLKNFQITSGFYLVKFNTGNKCLQKIISYVR
jgi:hypothetical protein